MQLRELFIRIKIDAKDAIRDLQSINKGFDEIRKDSKVAGSQVEKTGKEFETSGKKASKANKETQKTTKGVGDEAKKTGEKVKSAGRKAKTGFEDMGKGARTAKDRFKSFASGAKAGLLVLSTGVVAAQAAILGMARSFANAGSEIELQAQQFNLTTDTVQKLQGAAKLIKIEFDEVTDGIKELRTKTIEAKEDGLTEFSTTLNQLGLDANSFDLLKPIDQLKLIADRLKTLHPDVDQTTVLMRLFGEEAGVRLAPLLNKGGKQIDDLIGRFTELGGIMDKDALAKANELNTEFIEVGIVLKSVAKIIVRELAPTIKDIAKEIKKWARENRELQRGKLVEFLKSVTKLTAQAIPLFVDLANGVATFIDAIGGVTSALGLLSGGFLAFKLAAIPVIGPWIAGFTVLLSLVNSYNQSLKQAAQNQSEATQRSIDPLQFRETGEFTTDELRQTKTGRQILELEAQRAAIGSQLEAQGGAAAAPARERAVKREVIDEFPVQGGVGLAGFEEEAEEEKRLTDESAKLDKQISEKIVKLRNRQIRDSREASRAAKAKGTGGLPSGATPDDLIRQSELATRRLTGKLTEAEKRELKALETSLGIKAPVKKDADGKKKGRKKEKKEKAPTLADLLGVKDPKSGSRIATGQPRGLSTVIQNFNIQNTIGVPKFEVVINGVRSNNPRELARTTVDAVSKGFNQIVVNAQRAATTQVVG